jgi:sporulation protein YlmC with PRC-barrel domain
MSQATEIIIGSEVACSDGVCGELSRVVVDPVARTVTHLVVEPKHRQGLGRLVPIDLVESSAKELLLRCAVSEFEALENADEALFAPGLGGQWGFGQDLAFRLGGMGMMGPSPQVITTDLVPEGDVEVLRGDHVHATDGNIGRIRGLLIDSTNHLVTHVLLDEGHLWGQKKVLIPISAVAGVNDGIRLNLTKDEVRDLPPVELDHAE